MNNEYFVDTFNELMVDKDNKLTSFGIKALLVLSLSFIFSIPKLFFKSVTHRSCYDK